MLYSTLVATYEKIEATRKRSEMTDYLGELFKNTPTALIAKIVYLTMGGLYPEFEGVELGLAEKLCIKALYFVSAIHEKEIIAAWHETGDLGETAALMVARKKQRNLYSEPLTLARVYNNLDKIARASGNGAQDLKIKLLVDLLHDSGPNEAKYIMRTVLGRLRLGIADMTILDALALAYADKEDREKIERAYNVCSDLGEIARLLSAEGIEGIEGVSITLNVPVRMMLAERLSSVDDIFEKLGRCAFEYKYDGLRIQAHIGEDAITTLYSRRIENITTQFPDVCDALAATCKGNALIVEGECVPVNLETDELLPFQTVSRRRGRKYDLSTMIEDYPVVLFLFDCLYANGRDLTSEPYLNRRKALEARIKETKRIRLSAKMETDDTEAVERFFQQAIDAGCEGLIAKSTRDTSIYRAGARGWLWIKYKRDYKSEMVDTVDLVALGGFAGRGRRKGTYGALLMGAYNKTQDRFETVCKLGTGFDDATLAQLGALFRRTTDKDPRINSEMTPDYWFEPAEVMEVLGAEITLSPIHTCAYGVLEPNTGLAVRFPRFTGRWRDDKKPEDATSVDEIIAMYKMQLRTVE